MSAQTQERRARTPEERAAYLREWKARNPARLKAYAKKAMPRYRAKNRPVLNAKDCHRERVRKRTFSVLRDRPQVALETPLYLAHKGDRVMLGISGTPSPSGWVACAVLTQDEMGWRVSAPLTLKTTDTDGKTVLTAARCWARKQRVGK